MTDMRDERLQIMLSPEELSVLDDFRIQAPYADARRGCPRTATPRPHGQCNRRRRTEVEQLWRGEPR